MAAPEMSTTSAAWAPTATIVALVARARRRRPQPEPPHLRAPRHPSIPLALSTESHIILGLARAGPYHSIRHSCPMRAPITFARSRLPLMARPRTRWEIPSTLLDRTTNHCHIPTLLRWALATRFLDGGLQATPIIASGRCTSSMRTLQGHLLPFLAQTPTSQPSPMGSLLMAPLAAL